jgi:hypothetical protein
MAKIQYVEQRLLLWAEWVDRGGRSPGGTLAMFNGAPSDGVPNYNIPLNDEECWQTDKAVADLPSPLRETIQWHYVYGSNVAKERMQTTTAVHSQRMDRAHKMLWAVWQPKEISPNSRSSIFQ